MEGKGDGNWKLETTTTHLLLLLLPSSLQHTLEHIESRDSRDHPTDESNRTAEGDISEGDLSALGEGGDGDGGNNGGDDDLLPQLETVGRGGRADRAIGGGGDAGRPFKVGRGEGTLAG